MNSEIWKSKTRVVHSVMLGAHRLGPSHFSKAMVQYHIVRDEIKSLLFCYKKILSVLWSGRDSIHIIWAITPEYV